MEFYTEKQEKDCKFLIATMNLPLEKFMESCNLPCAYQYEAAAESNKRLACAVGDSSSGDFPNMDSGQGNHDNTKPCYG